MLFGPGVDAGVVEEGVTGVDFGPEGVGVEVGVGARVWVGVEVLCLMTVVVFGLRLDIAVGPAVEFDEVLYFTTEVVDLAAVVFVFVFVLVLVLCFTVVVVREVFTGTPEDVVLVALKERMEDDTLDFTPGEDEDVLVVLTAEVVVLVLVTMVVVTLAPPHVARGAVA